MRRLPLLAVALIASCRALASYEPGSADGAVTVEAGGWLFDDGRPDRSRTGDFRHDATDSSDAIPGPCMWGPTLSPGPRHLAKLTAIGTNIFLYGGVDTHGNPISDMWSYANRRWTLLCERCAPGPRVGHVFAATDDAVLLFGGTDDLWGKPRADLWRFAPKNGVWIWTEMEPSPRAVKRSLGAYDPGRGRLVSYGGQEQREVMPVQTLREYDPASNIWHLPYLGSQKERPPALQDLGSAMSYVDGLGPKLLRGRVVLFGGGMGTSHFDKGSDAIWSWDGATWRQHCTSCTGRPRQLAAIGYHPARRELLIVGGYAGGEIAGTWAYGGEGLAYPCSGQPTARDSMGIATFETPLGAAVMLLGGNGECDAGSGTGVYRENCDEAFVMY